MLYSSLCLFSPTFFSCRFDSSKFRAVTLREGFWQHCVVMEDRLPLADPLLREPWPRSLEIAADDLRCCSACCLCALCCASLVSARPSLLRVLQVYADVISVLGSENISEVHLIPLFFPLSLFLVKSRYVVACELP